MPPIPIENEYSLPDPNTYDIPRTIETPSVENIQINTEEKVRMNSFMNRLFILFFLQTFNNEITTSPPPIIELQKSSTEIVPSEQKLESTIITKTETMPNVEVKESTTKGSYTLPTKKSKTKKVKEPKVKTEKKSGLFSNLFRHGDRKSKAPALDLPSVERDLSPNNELREPHRQDSDPLRIPNTDLPKPDLSLPTYDRPEVDMTTGQTNRSVEFSIPIVDLPPISDLHLPSNDQQPIDLNIDSMKVPNVNLPELQFTSNEQENFQLPEQQITTEIEEKLPELPLITDIKQENDVEHPSTIQADLPLTSPVHDVLDTQTDQKNFPIETDYEVKTDTVRKKNNLFDK